MLIRVVEREDGGVSFIRPVRKRRVSRDVRDVVVKQPHPNPVLAKLGRKVDVTAAAYGPEIIETEPDYYADVFGKAMANDPLLTGRPYVDLDDSTLPSRESRDQWRLRDGRVVVGED